ncbi:MAG TPA: glycoside hydrolase family 38 C-terminal domain-containing protein [Candidatus Limnocylindria bacterium]|nr:glycoside hydrolase family 38 C-terminal domain-containing protein [Candidatus Limnocylindria bacterium]
MTTATDLERVAEPATAPSGTPMRVTVYHHTHWDREWWTTRRDFSVRLADLIDRLLDILDADDTFTTFVLDGQAVMLEDYLELRPEQRDRLVARIREGRIHVGPWYVLADTLIPSGESAIRNLWLGRRVAESLDLPLMGVGYLPDQFGHAAQIPQILAGFGIGSAVVWRGFGAPPPGQGTDPNSVDLLSPPAADRPYYPRVHGRGRFPDEMQSEFWWEAPDGSRVLAHYLAHEYYISHAPDDALTDPDAWDRWAAKERDILDYLRPYATGASVLQPYGGDHLAVDDRLPELLRRLNVETDGRVCYEQGSLAGYLDEVRADAGRVSIVWRGEGRAFGRKAHLLPGVTSTRLYLKRLNHDAQVALERHAEPMQALAWMVGGPYERSSLWAAWRLVVQNQPHDSITGCSVDEVHRQNVARYEEAIDLGRFLALRAGERVAARVSADGVPDEARPFIVLNPLGFVRTDAARLLVDPSLEVTPATWRLVDDLGGDVPFQAGETIERRTALPSRRWTEVAFVARDVPSLGYRRFHLERRESASERPWALDHTILGIVARDKGAALAGDLAIGPNRLENEHLSVVVEPADGSLTVVDRSTGFAYEGLNVFADGGDAGDEYSYSWPVGDAIFSTRDVRPSMEWLEVGPARATLRLTWDWALPAGLTDDRRSRSSTMVPLQLHSDVTLHAGVKRVDIRTHGVNTARDHRLRVLLPLGAAVDVSKSESAFCVVERPVAIDEIERGSAEPAVPEFPQQAFTSVDADGRGLTIANRGLSEASVLDDDRGTVALTLVRSVGYLSRGDLLTRIEGAGPLMPTPEAQMIGPFVAEYSIIPHAGSWSSARSHRSAHEFTTPMLSVELPGARPLTDPWRREPIADGATLPAAASLLEVDGDLEVTAVKRAEERDELVVRLLNESDEPRSARLRPHGTARTARRLTLSEDRSDAGGVSVSEGAILVAAGPWELVTVGIGFDG